MKQFLILIFFFLSTNLLAQTAYRAVGFAGRDTVELGSITDREKSLVHLDVSGYKGAVHLIPLDAYYKDIASHLEQISQINSEESFNAAKSYVKDTLAFDVLYSSGMWKGYIQQWIGFFASARSTEEFTTVFVPDIKKVLDRTIPVNPKVASKLIQDLIEFFEQYGLQTAAESIAAYSMGYNLGEEHSDVAIRTVTASKLIGNQAPEIIEGMNMSNVVIFFHEIGCNSCEEQIHELKQYYPLLQEKGYHVISVAGGNNQQAFEVVAANLPWTDKICESGNFEGANFKKYGVVAAPTLYVTDSNGFVKGRYAQLSETGILIKEK